MTTLGFLLRRSARVPGGDDWLTSVEREWLAGRRAPQRIADWRLGRWTAKEAVGAFFEWQGRQRPSGVEVLAGSDGAPRALAGGQPLPVTLALSHAGNRALCLVGPVGVALGCDLERVESRSDAFVADYFTPAEIAALAAVDTTDRVLFVNLVWSAKESALKALRCGLREDTRSVEVTAALPAGSVAGRLEVTSERHGARFAGRWRRVDDLVATIVAAPPPAELVDLARVVDPSALGG